MTMTDPIADMLTRLRNANTAFHDTVEMPHSKLKGHIAEILKQALPGLMPTLRTRAVLVHDCKKGSVTVAGGPELRPGQIPDVRPQGVTGPGSSEPDEKG